VSDLTNIEKRGFEKLFGMGSGYVLDFSNKTFGEFVLDSVGIDVWDKKYNISSGSKANRLRAIWSRDTNHVVAKLLDDLLQYALEQGISNEDIQRYENCIRTIARLSQPVPVNELAAITPNSAEREFAVLAKSVHESIQKNQPEAGLDRLHTFSLKYLRVLCEQRGISTEKEKPLHSLIGEYVKHLKNSGHIESEMSERILKSSISTLDAFNDVRNNRSFAHDNTVLNYDESLLIFNHVCSSIRYIETLEKRLRERKDAAGDEAINDDIPF
jgi:Abortive infection C-terminus